MDGEIVQRAVTRVRLAPPRERRLGIGHEVLVHLDPKIGDPTDRALSKQLGDVADRGALDVIVAEDRDPAARARSPGHSLGLGERGRHRLLAPDMFARLERGDGHRRMEPGRRGDRDDVDLEDFETSAFQSAVAVSKPNSSARLRARLSSTSQSATRLTTGASPPKTARTPVQASAWHLPI